LLVWAVLTGILIAVGDGVVQSSTVGAFDRHATLQLVTHRDQTLNALMKGVTWLGSWIALVVVAALILTLCARRVLPWFALALAMLVWAGEAGGVTLAKHLVQRHRPPQKLWLVAAHGWSWPSGHTATAVVLFAVLATTLGYLFRPTLFRTIAWVGAIVAVLVVGFSRVWLGVHWTTDVIASTVFVASWSVAVLTLRGEVTLLGRPRSFRSGGVAG
jgi:undecaprenyl-diphosphatase